MSTLKVTTIQDTAGANSSTTSAIANGIAKAWVNFNGTGVIAIRASFNVSSLTDVGLGEYTINFTNALTDANYSIGGLASDSANAPYLVPPDSAAFQTTSIKVRNYNYVGNLYDSVVICVNVFR